MPTLCMHYQVYPPGTDSRAYYPPYLTLPEETAHHYTYDSLAFGPDFDLVGSITPMQIFSDCEIKLLKYVNFQFFNLGVVPLLGTQPLKLLDLLLV